MTSTNQIEENVFTNHVMSHHLLSRLFGHTKKILRGG